MIGGALLLVVAALPPLIADPRRGTSEWAVVVQGATPPQANGYLLALPESPAVPDQAWLQTAVALGARNVPVVAIGSELPPSELLPYLDGVCLDPSPGQGALVDLFGRLGGVPLVVAGDDVAAAVSALAAGVGSVLLPTPAAGWAGELVGLLAQPEAVRCGAGTLPAALRSADLATVVGLPRGFPGGAVSLPAARYGPITLIAHGSPAVLLQPQARANMVVLPPLADGGLLVAKRAVVGVSGAFESVAVSGEQMPSVAEVLARHQRAAARQERLLPRWRADQRLLVRVWVAELSRSFEVVLAGPAFFARGLGTDWEIVHAWVDGVAWDPDKLPDLPLLEPARPPVPPLALRLDPAYRYELRGREPHRGRPCYVLAFASDAAPGGPVRNGVAWIDAATFGLVELDESADRLPEPVRSTHSRTVYREASLGGESVWLPEQVIADDLVAAFGGTTTVHRELALDSFDLNPAEFVASRGSAWASPHRMLRDTPEGIVPLVPDGHGGRIPAVGGRVAARFLLVGAVWDPGLAIPLPFGGWQVQDFNFRGRGEQLRALVAGVVNDAAWSQPHGRGELTWRASTQLLPFTNTLFVNGQEVKAEEMKVMRQRVGVSEAISLGVTRFLLDLGVDRWDFGRTDNTSATFVLPPNTFEGVTRLEGAAVLGATTLSIAGEGGWRQHWLPWGIDGNEAPERSWRRARLAAVWEKALFPLAKLHLDGELWTGSHLDRFSAPSPARFGGVRIRGIATGRVIANGLGVVRASLAVPLSPLIRAEAGMDLGWVRDDRSGYRARPLSGVGAGISAPGPWGTLLEAAVGFPLATPGPRAPTIDVFLLRPLAAR
ncbi:MAG: hypothetical protein ACHQQS_00510 [Thermoanaerobaculales bacterium]